MRLDERIDLAFDCALHEPRPARKKRRLVVADDEEDPTAAPGGFLPEPSTAGGFLPSSPLSSPPPSTIVNPFTLLPLDRIPAALSSLGVPKSAHLKLMALFQDVAEPLPDSDDQQGIARNYFVDACRTVVVDEEEEDSGPELEYEDSEGEEYQEEVPVAVPSRSGGRTSRSNPNITSSGLPPRESVKDVKGKGRQRTPPSSDLETDDSSEPDPTSKSRSKLSTKKRAASSGTSTPRAGRPTKKGKIRDRNRPLTIDELTSNAETFNLFFENSQQLFESSGGRIIGMDEMREVAKMLVLKEPLDDFDVRVRSRPLEFSN